MYTKMNAGVSSCLRQARKPYRTKIKGYDELRDFLVYFFEYIQSEATSYEIMEYIRIHNLESSQYDISVAKLGTSMGKAKKQFTNLGQIFVSKGRQRMRLALWTLNRDTCTIPKMFTWTKQIRGRPALREFIQWYLTIVKKEATCKDISDYIHANDLESVQYEIDGSRINGVRRGVPNLKQAGRDRGGAIIWTLGEENG